MNSLRLLAPAKLNLFLHITGRRGDGYHQLQTLFQLLNYGDTLEFTPRDDGRIVLATELPGIATEDNLIWKAAKRLQEHTKTKFGATIAIEKRLPAGGGLGGGSSDAATTLLALNRLWNTQLSLPALAELGLTLGADVPVFVHGGTALAEGVGENLTPFSTPQTWFLVLIPNCHVATARVFSEPGLTRNTPRLRIAPALEGQWQNLRNDCEVTVRALYPEVDDAIHWLNTVANARLTGTGACVFADFATEQAAQQVQLKVPAKWQSFIAQSVDISPTHKQLSEQITRITQ